MYIVDYLFRGIELTLIDSINVSVDSDARLYPAYLDLFATLFALPLIWAVWKYRVF